MVTGAGHEGRDGGLNLQTAVSELGGDGRLLPTPTAQAAKHGSEGSDRGPGSLDDVNLWSVAARLGAEDERLLPTPKARDVKDAAFPPRLDARDDDVPSALKRLLPQDSGVPLLPTPAVNDMGAGKTPEEWDAWRDKMRASFANGNGHGPSLSIEALRLLPTPNTMDSMDPRSAEALASAQERGGCRNLKDVIPHELGDSESSGPGLLPTPTVSDARDGSHARTRALARMEDGVTTSTNLNHLFENDELYAFHMGGRVPTGNNDDDELMLFDMVPRPVGRLLPTPETGESLTGHGRRGGRPGNGKQSGESLEAVAEVLSGEAPLLGTLGAGLGEGGGRRSAEYATQEFVDTEPVLRFGPYEAAIRRWELVLGREAPPPSVPGKNGRPRLNPLFVEFMMGLPPGWVTDPVIGLPHNAQLKALGNGVVPLQALLALHLLLGSSE